MIILLINILVAILLTSLTGAVMVLIWYGIGIVLERIGFINIVFELLKMVICFFLLPIAYVFLKIFEFEIGRGYLFVPTATITKVSLVLVSLWGIGALTLLLYVLHDIHRLHKKYCAAIPCDREIQRVFEEVKRNMGMSKSPLQVKQSYYAEVPCVTGIRKPMIILPVENYSEEELYVILTHEVIHYKQKDLLLKSVSFIVLALHFFNPFAWILVLKIQKWSEYACDYKACEYVGGIKVYFEIIMNIAMMDSKKSCFSSQLTENQHELVGRVKKMKRLSQMKKRSKLSVALVLCMAFMTSSVSVYAMTLEGAEAYMVLEERTSVEMEAEPQEINEYEVYTENGDTEQIIVIEGQLNQQTRATSTIEWEVSNNTRVYGPYFSCEAGDNVIVVVTISPANINIKTGIENAVGTRTYVQGKDTIYYSFEIETAGKYRFFVENTGGADVSVEGSYIVQ